MVHVEQIFKAPHFKENPCVFLNEFNIPVISLMQFKIFGGERGTKIAVVFQRVNCDFFFLGTNLYTRVQALENYNTFCAENLKRTFGSCTEGKLVTCSQFLYDIA